MKRLVMLIMFMLVTVLAGCASAPPTTTLTLHVSRGSGGTVNVSYTCPDGEDGAMKVCTAPAIGGPSWEVQIAYPVGTTVRLQTIGGYVRSQCMILDQSKAMRIAEDDGRGTCTTTA
ncbi:hypothetical protein ACL02T_09770 [Pseudonocardia sp. RS010]|uniref:hypothetical protein n=1 Tax=Pseudonocardia sp. RS010 TaxID=3385979 RepID=UPI00399FC938